MSVFAARSGPLQRGHREDDGLQARTLLEALLEVRQPGFSAGENIKFKPCNCCIWLFVPHGDDPLWTKNKPDTSFWFNVYEICLYGQQSGEWAGIKVFVSNLHHECEDHLNPFFFYPLCYNSVIPGLFVRGALDFYGHLFHHQGWALNLFQENVLSACVAFLTDFYFYSKGLFRILPK